MKEFESKSVEEALAVASAETGFPVENLRYFIKDEVQKLFSKKVIIAVYDYSDVIAYVGEYLTTALGNCGITIEKIEAKIIDDVVNINITSDADARLIGKGGATLKALTDVVRQVATVHFKAFQRILLDIKDYKENKYAHIILMAKRIANDVKRTGITASIDNLTSDERRVIHNALADEKRVKTVSVGIGSSRKLTIEYVKSVEVSGDVYNEKAIEEAPSSQKEE